MVLEDLPRLVVFIDKECGNLKVFVDVGDLTRNINQKKSHVYKPVDVHSVTDFSNKRAEYSESVR